MELKQFMQLVHSTLLFPFQETLPLSLAVPPVNGNDPLDECLQTLADGFALVGIESLQQGFRLAYNLVELIGMIHGVQDLCLQLMF